MKPPICEVCNAGFSAKTGALVTCVGDAKSAAWDRRQAEGSFPGHPPNKGWFCSSHHEEAKRLSVLLTLPQVRASMRGDVVSTTPRPPVPDHELDQVDEPTSSPGPEPLAASNPTKARTCDVCGITFDEDTAGRVSFATTPEGIEWHRSMIDGAVTGTNPDHAWLCARHVAPALWISTLTRAQAMAELMPPGRDPLEYDERPASADPNASTFPRRTAFLPVTNDGLADARERWAEIAPHTPKAVHAAVHSARHQFGDALGVPELRNSGSASSADADPADTRWAAEGIWVGSSATPHQAGDVVVFVVRQIFRSGDRHGPIDREGLRLLIHKRERSILELTFLPAETPTVALDGLVLIERVLVRQRRGLERASADRLEAVVSELVATLSVEVEDPLSLVPDLVDVNLGSGSVARKRFGEGSTIEWADIAPTLDEVLPVLFASLPVFFDVLDLGAVPELEYSVQRKWDRIDGAQPPHCPFSETREWVGEADGLEVNISHQSANWNEDQVANQSASLLIRSDGNGVPLQLSMGDRCDGTGVSLTLQRPTSAALVAATRAQFGC